jgi:hypothetical protein
MDTIILQQVAMFRTSTRTLYVYITIMEKMVKQFAMTNSSPSTCVWMLHRMDGHLYDVQTVDNIFNKANKSMLD